MLFEFYDIYNLVLITLQLKIIVSEYDQEIPQSQTADNPVAPRGRAAVIPIGKLMQ